MKRPTRVTRGSPLVTALRAVGSLMLVYIERNLKTLMVSLLKPWRFCLKKIGPCEVTFTAIAVADHHRPEQRPARRWLKNMSKPRLATESQSRIGLSKMSSIGTWPTCE